MKQIRRISIYVTNIKDKYYVTDTGTFYVAITSSKVMKDGHRRAVSKNCIKQVMGSDKAWGIAFKDWGSYCLILKDGSILRRMSTYICKETGAIIAALITTLDKEVRVYASRIIAAVYLENVEGKEVHHVDRNRQNNSIANLEVLSFEEHRGIGSEKHV